MTLPIIRGGTFILHITVQKQKPFFNIVTIKKFSILKFKFKF